MIQCFPELHAKHCLAEHSKELSAISIILLMVQKSHSQPPFGCIVHPYKSWDIYQTISTGEWVRPDFWLPSLSFTKHHFVEVASSCGKGATWRKKTSPPWYRWFLNLPTTRTGHQWQQALWILRQARQLASWCWRSREFPISKSPRFLALPNLALPPNFLGPKSWRFIPNRSAKDIAFMLIAPLSTRCLGSGAKSCGCIFGSDKMSGMIASSSLFCFSSFSHLVGICGTR